MLPVFPSLMPSRSGALRGFTDLVFDVTPGQDIWREYRDVLCREWHYKTELKVANWNAAAARIVDL